MELTLNEGKHINQRSPKKMYNYNCTKYDKEKLHSARRAQYRWNDPFYKGQGGFP